ncbi:class I SAM-dependent methyltransferase [Flavobacteriaceae bacterium 14752]|uniref:class I SAM-dependent methyltransferase n=1 Tax=Mesohalobacter salilacus TaxID=2491711 RepID=UPI000F63C8C3|nr:class I SAM-dependent methyltransferase [Flavobacteriaceae bacterium 14752]
MDKKYLEINQKLWDDKTPIHLKSDFYNVNAFERGESSLNPIELNLLGNLKNKSVLHLQCHFGLDSMSLTRLGAKVTGIDFSNTAINEAINLRNKLGLATQFVQSDIYSLDEKINSKFDIIYTSYGVLGWLPDMPKWAKVISHFLKPSGKLVLVEFHPIVWMFNSDFNKIDYPYSSGQAIIENTKGSYADSQAPIENKSISWNHGLAKVFRALIFQNMEIEDFQEYNYSPYNCFENTIKVNENQYQIKGLENKFPLLYSIIAKNK